MAKRPWYRRIVESLGFGKRPIKEASASTKKNSNLIKKVGLAFVRGGTSRDFEPPMFDLDEVTKAYNTESYVRQAIDKYVDLMFKAGWNVEGKNPNAVEYINMRLEMISMATGMPIDQFFIEIAEDLVKYGNVFIIKARDKSGLGPSAPGIRATGIDGQPPVAGYFLLNPTTIEIARDKHGTVARYKQEVQGQEPVEYKPEDIIHIYYKKDRGRAFGTPYVIPVLDDIKALREAEENVLRLIYKHIFPFYVYQVGLPEPGFEASDEEILEVEDKILNMPMDGGLVVPERHNLKAVGAEGHALKAENYLKYFEQRVFTGLGVSEMQMGRGDSSNRSTSDAMTTEMHDRVKAFQRVMSVFVDKFIIDELLLEGGFDPLSRPDDDVDFDFNEIELESKIKEENHIIYQYEHNAISEDEMRRMLGREPIQDAERESMFLNLVTLTQAAAKATETGEPGNKETNNKNKPANQSGTKSGPKKKTERLEESLIDILYHKEYESMLDYHWQLTKDDILALVRHYYLSGERDLKDFDSKEIEGIIHLTKESMSKIAAKYNRGSFFKGTDDARNDTNWTKMPEVSNGRYLYRLSDENKKSIDSLMNKLSSLIVKIVRSSKQEDTLAKVIGAFSALSYRIRFIAYSETMKSYNYGYAVSAKALDRNEITIITNDENTCSKCTNNSAIITLEGDFYDVIPPFHPNCSCTAKIKE